MKRGRGRISRKLAVNYLRGLTPEKAHDMSEDPERGGEAGSPAENGHAPLYTLPSNQSASSIFEDVEMAQDEVRFNRKNCASPVQQAS